MGSIALMSFRTKKRIEARLEDGRYPSLARSISLSVCSVTTRDSWMEIDVAFDVCRVFSKSGSSRKAPPATLSKLTKVKA